MKTYRIFWTYIANYADHPVRVQASNPKDAILESYRYMSDDFKKKARILLFEVGGDIVYDGLYSSLVNDTTGIIGSK